MSTASDPVVNLFSRPPEVAPPPTVVKPWPRAIASGLYVVFAGLFSFPGLLLGFTAGMTIRGLVGGWQLSHSAYEAMVESCREPYGQPGDDPYLVRSGDMMLSPDDDE